MGTCWSGTNDHVTPGRNDRNIITAVPVNEAIVRNESNRDGFVVVEEASDDEEEIEEVNEQEIENLFDELEYHTTRLDPRGHPERNPLSPLTNRHNITVEDGFIRTDITGDNGRDRISILTPESLAEDPFHHRLTQNLLIQIQRARANGEFERLERDEMEGFFESLVGQAFRQEGEPDANRGAPPASEKALRQLPTVALCAEDLMEESNRECCICTEENTIGSKVARLPCGHVFHRPCIEDWLKRKCTCPICRYELETNDAIYEKGRLERMKSRKLRFRQHELQRFSVRQLRELMTFLNVQGNINVVEKNELIEIIVNSGKIIVIPSPTPIDFKLSDLRSKGIGKLKKIMNEAGVFFDPVDVVEKEDMVQLFINSGRVNLLPEAELEEIPNLSSDYNRSVVMSESGMEDTDLQNFEFDNSGGSYSREIVIDQGEVSTTDTSNSLTSSPQGRMNYEPSSHSTSHLKTYLSSKSISELKALGRQLGVSLYDCVEKNDMVDKLSLSPVLNG